MRCGGPSGRGSTQLLSGWRQVTADHARRSPARRRRAAHALELEERGDVDRAVRTGEVAVPAAAWTLRGAGDGVDLGAGRGEGEGGVEGGTGRRRR